MNRGEERGRGERERRESGGNQGVIYCPLACLKCGMWISG